MVAEEYGASIREAGVRDEIAALEAHEVTRKIAERNMIEGFIVVVWIFFTCELG